MIVTFGEWLLARGSGRARVPVAAEREVSVSRHNSLPEAHHLVTVLLHERDEARSEAERAWAAYNAVLEDDQEADALRAEAERLRAAIQAHREEAAYLHDGRDEHLWSVLDDAADPVAQAVEARTREIVEALRGRPDELGGAHEARVRWAHAADFIESRFLSGGDDA